MNVSRRGFLKSGTLAGMSLLTAPGLVRSQSQSRPNIMIVLADDMVWRDCGCYGNPEVSTPNMDRLAEEGRRFDNCFTSTAVCAPTRQQLYTGMFPVRSGAYPQAGFVYPGTRSIAHHLKDAGYRVGLVGKTHYGPAESYPFDFVGTDPNIPREEGGNRVQIGEDRIADFVNASSDQPYCLIVASHNPHLPYSSGQQEAYDPETLTLPPYLIDTPETRRCLAKYYAEITALDVELGMCMDFVEASAQAEDTLLMFSSEQGSAFPFGGKWSCYENGLHTGLIARWPGRIEPGSTSNAMVQYVDIVPTLLQAANQDPSLADTGRPGDPDGGTGFDGRSFYNILMGDGDHHRDHVYGVYTNRGVRDGTDYPIRSVRSDRYKYIANLNHEETFRCNVTRFMSEMGWAEAAKGHPELERRVDWMAHRPAEEFYDLNRDPFELNNLAGDPAYAEISQGLQAELESWMTQQGDRGLQTELEALEHTNPAGRQARVVIDGR